MKIKNRSTILSVLVGILSLGMTSSVFASGNMHKHHGSKMKVEGKRTSVNQKDKKQILAVFQANEGLHSSFFKFDAKKVNVESRKVVEAIANIENKDIKKLLTFAEKKLVEMSSLKSQEDLNKNYNLVSMALIHVMKSYDIGKEYNAYSCPMVKKKWVQNSSKMGKVHNPYASNMPHCGSQDTKFGG